MKSRPQTKLWAATTAITLASIADATWGYVGPGAGLGMLGSLIAVVFALLLALAGLVVLPVRMILKRLRATEGHPEQAQSTVKNEHSQGAHPSIQQSDEQ